MTNRRSSLSLMERLEKLERKVGVKESSYTTTLNKVLSWLVAEHQSLTVKHKIEFLKLADEDQKEYLASFWKYLKYQSERNSDLRLTSSQVGKLNYYLENFVFSVIEGTNSRFHYEDDEFFL